MKRLLFILLSIPTFLFAQVDARYLEGAVPTEDGKVVFTRKINAPAFNKAEIYQLLLDWGKENFHTKEKRVAFQNEESGEIALVGEDYLVFSSNAFSLDRTLITYRVIITCEEQACLLRMMGIRYRYDVTYQKEPERYLAEEWITDDIALNKSKTKLSHSSGKFRKATIDFAQETFDSAANALRDALMPEVSDAPAPTEQTITAPIAQTITPPTEQPNVTPEEQSVTTSTEQPVTTSMEGFVTLPADNMSTTILQMLPDNKLQVRTEDGNATDSNAEWKGYGKLSGKTICTISLSLDSPIYKAIEDNDIYKLFFFKPELTVNEAWIIMECRKQGESSEGKQVTLIGELTNVWIK